MLHSRTRRHRKNGRGGASNIGVRAVEGNVSRRRVAVERFSGVGAGASDAVGLQRNDRLTPVVVAVELTGGAAESVAGAQENAVGASVVDDSRARPDGVLACRTGRRDTTAEDVQMRGLV